MPVALIAILTGFVVLASGPLVLFLFDPARLAPRRPGKGKYVAEVWLNWEICRGSTMYRQRFRFKWQAAVFAKLYAVVLDGVLPTHWRSTDYLGRPCMEKYEYGIEFGVRQVTEREATDFYAVWTTVMPGHNRFAGEHATAHPMLAQLTGDGLNGSVVGYKL